MPSARTARAASTARTARAAAAPLDRAGAAGREKHRKAPLGVANPTLRARDRRVRILERAACGEFVTTFLAVVFINRHCSPHYTRSRHHHD